MALVIFMTGSKAEMCYRVDYNYFLSSYLLYVYLSDFFGVIFTPNNFHLLSINK